MYKGQELIVLDLIVKTGRLVVYHAGFDKNTDIMEEVEIFFEEAGVDIPPSEVETIASQLSKKGFYNWENYHFEIVY